MKQKKKLLITVVIVAVVLALGITALAATTFGTKSNPLVTLSYLNRIKTEITNTTKTLASDTATSTKAAVDDKIDDFTADIEAKIAGLGNDGTAVTFLEVELASGQTLSGSAGTELLLRSGAAVSNGRGSALLTDVTGGNVVATSGASISANHMYVVAADGCGIAASSACTVLVRGDYTIA